MSEDKEKCIDYNMPESIGAKSTRPAIFNNMWDAKELINLVQSIHYTIKDDSIKHDEMKVLLEYRDRLINTLKEI